MRFKKLRRKRHCDLFGRVDEFGRIFWNFLDHILNKGSAKVNSLLKCQLTLLLTFILFEIVLDSFQVNGLSLKFDRFSHFQTYNVTKCQMQASD